MLISSIFMKFFHSSATAYAALEPMGTYNLQVFISTYSNKLVPTEGGGGLLM